MNWGTLVALLIMSVAIVGGAHQLVRDDRHGWVLAIFAPPFVGALWAGILGVIDLRGAGGGPFKGGGPDPFLESLTGAQSFGLSVEARAFWTTTVLATIALALLARRFPGRAPETATSSAVSDSS